MKWTAGQSLRTLAKPTLTTEQLREYAASSGDTNPIHLDLKVAQEAGFNSVIVHGMISMAFLADHIAYNFPKEEFTVTKFRVRFRRVTFPGDTLICEGEVRKIAPQGVVIIHNRTRNQHGDVTAEGEAHLIPAGLD